MMQNKLKTDHKDVEPVKTPNTLEHNIPVIGITGGVGSGKSRVMEVLEKDYHAALIIADEVGHELMEPGTVCYQRILDHFGSGILDPDSPDGRISRPALAAIVFSDKKELETLNEITHSEIRKEIMRRIEAFRQTKEYPFIALEAALLIEGGLHEITDQVWYVRVSEKERIRRLMKGRGYTEEKCRSVMKDQLQDDVFLNYCSAVIDNNGTAEETWESIRRALIEGNII